MFQSDQILLVFLVSNDSSQNKPIELGLHHRERCLKVVSWFWINYIFLSTNLVYAQPTSLKC